MNRPLKTVTLSCWLFVLLFIGACSQSNKMKVSFVNQTSLPVNMYVSGEMCTNENMVLDRGMRSDEFTIHNAKNTEEFEVAVNNQVLVRKSLEWKKDAKEIVVVYNGADLLLTY